MSPRSKWTDARLTRLFERYRMRYWPTSRRLRAFCVKVSQLERAYGQCDYDTKTLLIDVDAHRSDRELRATVLHEMIHAVLGAGGHHSPFWTQLEYLLSERAPVTVGFPELGERGTHLSLVPRRFRRCRRLFRPAYERQQREMEKLARNLGEIRVTPGGYRHAGRRCGDRRRRVARLVVAPRAPKRLRGSG